MEIPITKIDSELYADLLVLLSELKQIKVIVKMEAVITALTTTLTPVAFFGIVKDLVPFIGVMVPVALALYFLRKLVKGAGKGKVKF